MLHAGPALTPRLQWSVLGASVLTFTILALTAPGGGFEEIERALMLSLRDSENPALLRGPDWLSYFMQNITALGGWPVLTVLAVALSGAFALRRRWPILLVLLAVVLGESSITGLLKDLFGRERPDFIPHLIYSSSASFPSGHAASAAAVYLTFGFAITNLMTRKVLRYYSLGAALLIIFLIGVSRVYLGVHYPSDVVAGWCVGAAWASAVWLAADRLQR